MDIAAGRPSSTPGIEGVLGALSRLPIGEKVGRCLRRCLTPAHKCHQTPALLAGKMHKLSTPLTSIWLSWTGRCAVLGPFRYDLPLL